MPLPAPLLCVNLHSMNSCCRPRQCFIVTDFSKTQISIS